jgi:hypothetical protein
MQRHFPLLSREVLYIEALSTRPGFTRAEIEELVRDCSTAFKEMRESWCPDASLNFQFVVEMLARREYRKTLGSRLSDAQAEAIRAAYDFAGMATIVDVGGGHGALLAEILKTYPHMRGILFDLPAVVESAQPLLEAAGITARCTCVAGDFFQTMPGGGDAYILKRVIHDWDDAPAAAMLTQCRRAMPAHSRLLLMERVIPPGNAPSVGKLADITMLLHYGGLERTEAEYRGLLEAVGFTLVRIIPTQAPLSIIEGVPA